MKRAIVVILLVPVMLSLLASCAFLPTIGDIERANDTAIAAWKRAGCAFPLSAIQRNPEIIPALNVLCKGSAQASDVVKP